MKQKRKLCRHHLLGNFGFAVFAGAEPDKGNEVDFQGFQSFLRRVPANSVSASAASNVHRVVAHVARVGFFARVSASVSPVLVLLRSAAVGNRHRAVVVVAVAVRVGRRVLELGVGLAAFFAVASTPA